MFLAGEDELCNPTLKNAFPESASGVNTAKGCFDLFPKFTGNPGKPTVGCGNQCFQSGFQHPGQNRGRAARADGDDDGRAIDDGGHGEGAKIRLIDDVDGHVLLPSRVRDCFIHIDIVGSRNHDQSPV